MATCLLAAQRVFPDPCREYHPMVIPPTLTTGGGSANARMVRPISDTCRGQPGFAVSSVVETPKSRPARRVRQWYRHAGVPVGFVPATHPRLGNRQVRQ